MKAFCWHGKGDISCDTVPDPKVEHPRGAVIEMAACAICGSDLHLYNGSMPGMRADDVMGYETMRMRVAGDAFDLAALGVTLLPGTRRRGVAALAMIGVMAITVLDLAEAAG